MPQTLKDDVKERIVDAAKQEFMKNSYDKASMRVIAGKSKITVGNLYRYFKSKEDLNRFIVAPALEKIQNLVLEITNNQVDILNPESFDLTTDQMRTMLDSLADGVVDIYMEHRIEVNILMMRTSINKYLTDWFSNAIAQIIARNYNLDSKSSNVKLMADGYAVSIFNGFTTILRNSTVDNDTLKRLIKIYMESYVDMLDVDLVKSLRGEQE